MWRRSGTRRRTRLPPACCCSRSWCSCSSTSSTGGCRSMSPDRKGTTLEVDVRVAFGGFDLQVEQAIPAAGVTAVFGPSGSGKTTLLRSVLGFEAGSRGRIALNGDVWLDSEAGVDVPPHRRPVGCTFQDGRLFPHLDVAGNLRYADRRSGEANAVSINHDDVVDALDLEPLLDRRPNTLSGGERQRAALGRALLSRPRLLLLDEPLSALDRRRKAEIMPYLLALHPRFGIPTLYVSHAVDEVALLADRVLVLAEGRVQAFGGTIEVLEQLDLAPLTERFQAAAVLEARVSAHDDQYRLTWLDLDGQRLSVPRIEHLDVGESARLLVRSRDVSLATERPSPTSIRNVLSGVLVSLHQDESSAFAEATIDLGSHRLRARITRASAAELDLAVGSPVFALLKSVSLDTRAGR
ncbi:MAG: molybdenum ABC transporter ATP-binding protein [Holophagales bacterium]|nr:molybdenum ABC transporter ATP-binding protein [Holophagales bacterium]MYH25699.1 molybdenum ABC transporter ATP-binding protein [Holophagales bacterium]